MSMKAFFIGTKTIVNKPRNDNENKVNKGKGKSTLTILPPDVTDDYMKNKLGMSDSQVKQIRENSKAMKQTNVDGTMNDQEKMINDPNGSTSTDKNIIDLLMKLRENGEVSKTAESFK